MRWRTDAGLPASATRRDASSRSVTGTRNTWQISRTLSRTPRSRPPTGRWAWSGIRAFSNALHFTLRRNRPRLSSHGRRAGQEGVLAADGVQVREPVFRARPAPAVSDVLGVG